MSIEQDLEKILKEYTEEVGELTNDVMRNASRETVNDLKSTSPKLSGDYARDWAVKTERGAGGSAVFIVHNKKHYQLTHLLENGHIIRNQYGEYGRAPAHPHIKQAEQNAIKSIIATLEAKL